MLEEHARRRRAERLRDARALERATRADAEVDISAAMRSGGVRAGAAVDGSSRELREQVRRLRHDAELLDGASIESREALVAVLRDVAGAFDKELRWTSDRMVRHAEPVSRSLLGNLHFEVDGLAKSMRAALRGACRALRGKLLPTDPTEVLSSAMGAALRKDQLKWLQGCCGVIFPHCLVCVFDPTAQDELDESPWTVLETGTAAAGGQLVVDRVKPPGVD